MRILLIAIIIFNSFLCRGQNLIGIPDITNYSKSIYQAGTQNRGIVQDKGGVMYFANYEGLLSFDGVYWKTYAIFCAENSPPTGYTRPLCRRQACSLGRSTSIRRVARFARAARNRPITRAGALATRSSCLRLPI